VAFVGHPSIRRQLLAVKDEEDICNLVSYRVLKDGHRAVDVEIVGLCKQLGSSGKHVGMVQGVACRFKR
jgi:hypothetical protein